VEGSDEVFQLWGLRRMNQKMNHRWWKRCREGFR
jgi:hypothetical protein